MNPFFRHIYYYSQGGGETPTLFVSSSGSSGDGTEANPWSPAEFLTALATIEAGEIIGFKRGDTFEIGEIDITVANLTFLAYGEGDDPVFTGSEDISGLVWTDTGGGIYSAPMAEEPNWIWIDGECAKNAETARIPIVSRGDTTHITIAHSAVSGFSSIVGSYCVVKEKVFRNSQRVTVTAYDGAGVITIDDAINIANNVDLVLYNNTEYLSGNNEWAWESGTLYVKAAASPSTLNIRSSAYDYCFKTTASTTTFKNLEIQEYFQFGVWSNGAIVNVNNCSFHDLRDSAVLIQRGETGVNISSNTMARIGNTAIFTRPTTNLIFDSNNIEDIGMQQNYGWQTWTDGAIQVSGGTGIAIGSADILDDTVTGSNNQITNNTVTNVAYNGISVSTSSNNIIQNNTVSDFTNRFTDGAGIYTFHYRLYDVPQENTEISNNIVFNNNDAADSFGIYCDNRTKAANVHHNVVDDCEWGILFNYDTTDHTCEDNIVRNCTKGIVFRQADTELSTLYANNVNNQFNRNIIACTISTQRCVGFEIASGSFPTWNPFSGTGGADNNIYINPYSVNIADSDNEGNDLTLTELQTAYGEDAASTEHTNYITAPGFPSQNLLLIKNSTSVVVNGTAPEGYNNASGVEVTDYTVPANYGLLLVAKASSENSIFFESASSQHVNFGTTADIQFERTDAFSIRFRFKIPVNPASGQSILTNFGAANRGFTVSVLSTGQIQFELRNTVSTNRYTYTTTGDYADNVGHEILIVKPTAHADTKIYIDNTLDTGAEVDNLSATIVSTEDLFLGVRETISSYFDGYIDELAIWSSDQDANRTEIWNGGLTHDLTEISAPPLHYWKLGDDGYVDSGTSATKLNGTAVNNPTISTDVP